MTTSSGGIVCLHLSPVDEEGSGDSSWPQCYLHHVPHYGGEVLSLLAQFTMKSFKEYLHVYNTVVEKARQAYF